MKTLLSCNQDPYLALLNYRATPLPWCGQSPAELLMGRKIRTRLPQTKNVMIPNWPYLKDFRRKNEVVKSKQKRSYDRRHRFCLLPEIPEDTPVWITSRDRQIPGRVDHQAETPRSYVVDTPSGQVQRNRRHLTARITDQDNSNEGDPDPQSTRSPIMTRSCSGATINPPNRLTL